MVIRKWWEWSSILQLRWSSSSGTTSLDNDVATKQVPDMFSAIVTFPNFYTLCWHSLDPIFCSSNCTNCCWMYCWNQSIGNFTQLARGKKIKRCHRPWYVNVLLLESGHYSELSVWRLLARAASYFISFVFTASYVTSGLLSIAPLHMNLYSSPWFNSTGHNFKHTLQKL